MFEPFDQNCFAHQPSAAKLKEWKSGNTGDNAVKQIAEMRLAASEQ
jgi:hypothetical protein